MKPLLVIENAAEVPLGYLADVLSGSATEFELIRPYADDPVPGHEDRLGIIILGGAMGAYDVSDYPFLTDQQRLLAYGVAAGIPVLGICLGGQLLADSLGGRSFRAHRTEARFEAIESDAASSDPVLRELDGPMLSFHRDTWQSPPGSQTLLESAQYPQAFRIGSALAIQCHPEVTPEIVRSWMETPQGRQMLADAGADGEEILSSMEAARDASADMALRFFTAWLADLRTIGSERRTRDLGTP